MSAFINVLLIILVLLIVLPLVLSKGFWSDIVNILGYQPSIKNEKTWPKVAYKKIIEWCKAKRSNESKDHIKHAFTTKEQKHTNKIKLHTKNPKPELKEIKEEFSSAPTKIDKNNTSSTSNDADNHDPVASSAKSLQAHAQKTIFICLSLLLIAKGFVEVLDTLNFIEKVQLRRVIYYWTLNDFKLAEVSWTQSVDKYPVLSHIKNIRTLTYVANALAISCGLQLAYMLITDGPDEAVEPIMLGVASVILLILSTVEPNQWGIYNSISIILLILGIFLLHYMSKRLGNSENKK